MTSRNNQNGGMLHFLLNSVVQRVVGAEIKAWARIQVENAQKEATELVFKHIPDELKNGFRKGTDKILREMNKSEGSEERIAASVTKELRQEGLDEDTVVLRVPRSVRQNYDAMQNVPNIVGSPGEQPKTLTHEQKVKLAADIEYTLGVKGLFTPEQIGRITINELPPHTRGGKKRKTNKKRKLKRRKTRRKH